MSIWCSGEVIGYERLNPRSRATPQRGEVRSYAHGWSNHFPDRAVEQRANIDVATIPPWCVPGHREDYDDEAVGPWVRIWIYTRVHDASGKPTRGMTSAAVVLDEQAARSLAADLLAWADQPKAQPA